MSIDKEARDRLFVTTWLTAVKHGSQADWIAQELDLPKTYVLNRARNLRKHGVKLPKLPDGRQSANDSHFSELNDLIEGDK
jgi:hypothetical protein